MKLISLLSALVLFSFDVFGAERCNQYVVGYQMDNGLVAGICVSSVQSKEIVSSIVLDKGMSRDNVDLAFPQNMPLLKVCDGQSALLELYHREALHSTYSVDSNGKITRIEKSSPLVPFDAIESAASGDPDA